MDFNYEKLQEMDCVCTASTSIIGRLIRFWTAPMRNKSRWKEMFRLSMANHTGLVVRVGDYYWVAEMLWDGLKISSLREYTKSKKEVAVAMRRLPVFDDESVREDANRFVVDLAFKAETEYDKKGILQFLGICQNHPKWAYCSELCEIVANRYGATWDKWQLRRTKGKDMIAPVEIQYGTGEPVKNFLVETF